MDQISIELAQLENWNFGSTKPERVGEYQISIDGLEEADFYNLAREVEELLAKEKGDGWESQVSKNRFEHGASSENGLINIILHDPILTATGLLIGKLLTIQIQRLVHKYCPEPSAELGEIKIEDALKLAQDKLVKTFTIPAQALRGGKMKLEPELLTVEFESDKKYVYTRTRKGIEACYWLIERK